MSEPTTISSQAIEELLDAARAVRNAYWGTEPGLEKAIEELDRAITKAGGWEAPPKPQLRRTVAL